MWLANRKIERALWIVLSLGLALGVGVQRERTMRARKSAPIRESDYAKLTRQYLELQHSRDSLDAALRRMDPLDEIALDRMRKGGLQDPVRDLTADLEKHNELIPYPGVLGGTMRFTQVRVLSSKYALAAFEDGHVSGEAVLEYAVLPGGKISWKIVGSHADY